MIIQIYGSTTPEDARMLVELGVENIGVAIGVSEHSFDIVPLEQAQLIFQAIPQKHRVALVITSDPDEIEHVARTVQPAILHLAGMPQAMDAEAVREIRRRLPGLPIMRAIPMTGPEAIGYAAQFQDVAEYLLLDSFSPMMDGGIGATGKLHDWSISRRIVEESRIPVILAGGLSPENVAEAIRVVRPYGVDSLTHTSDPANLKRKDRQRVEAFIQAARNVVLE
jgi:phosphoribosylanthranilate isomerase